MNIDIELYTNAEKLDLMNVKKYLDLGANPSYLVAASKDSLEGFEVFKCLVEHSEIPKKVITESLNICKGNYELINYLVEKFNIELDTSVAVEACKYDKVDTLKYLKIKNVSFNQLCFDCAAVFKSFKCIDYLMAEYGMEFTECISKHKGFISYEVLDFIISRIQNLTPIEDYIGKNGNENLNKLIEKRKLELSIKNTNFNKRFKI